MQQDIDRILISSRRIADRVGELAAELAREYAPPGREQSCDLTIVAILSGSLIFLADLIRRLPMRMRIALVTVSSYPGASTESRGARLFEQITADVAGRDVLIVDDILDTGGTLRAVRAELARRQPRSIRTCVLLRKPAKAPPDVPADFVGFDIDNYFVVGYGLDYDGLYRNLPDIAVLRPELYTSGPGGGRA